MASRRPPVYAKMVMTHSNYRTFKARLDAATREALIEAGGVGRRVARDSYKRKYATGPPPSTKQSINFRTDTKHFVMIYVGTLRGAIKEFGTKVRDKRGRQEAQPFLRPGMSAALATILPAIRRRAPSRRRL